MRSLRSSTAPAVMAAAVTLMLISLFDTDASLSQALYRIGLALSILAATGWVLSRTSATDEYVKQVKRSAYNRGYEAGCEVRRVTHLHLVDSADMTTARSVAFPDSSAAQEFDEKHRLGDGTERVG